MKSVLSEIEKQVESKLLSILPEGNWSKASGSVKYVNGACQSIHTYSSLAPIGEQTLPNFIEVQPLLERLISLNEKQGVSYTLILGEPISFVYAN